MTSFGGAPEPGFPLLYEAVGCPVLSFQITRRVTVNFGSRLARARSSAGLSLRQLAAVAGTSHATLSDYEHGRRDPRVSTAERIGRAAGFQLELRLHRRADHGAARIAKGRELADVLELAEAFPARHDAQLAMPRFGRPR